MIQPAADESIDRMKEYAQQDQKADSDGGTGKLNVNAYLAHYGIEFKFKKSENADLYVLDRCLFNQDHGRGQSAIGQRGNGALFYKCFHASCQNRTWKDARQIISGNASIRDFIEGAEEIKAEQAKPDEWSDPIPFDDNSLLPDFPVDVLPDIGKRIVSGIAEVTQVDAGLPGLMYLAMLSACRSGDEVSLISHKEPCNLYLAAILPSGHRKTPVNSELSLPLYDYQEQKRIELSDSIREATNQFEILKQRLQRVQRQAAQAEEVAERHELMREVNALSLEMEGNSIPVAPTFICDDITTEGLGALMTDNNERMAILSAEGGIFKLIGGLYTEKEGNFDLYLKAHAGDPWSSHRVGREAQSMRKPSLTMGLAIQPDVLDEIGRNKHFRGRGLLARFLFGTCKSQVGYRQRQTRALPASLIQEYRSHIFSLMDIPRGNQFALTLEGQDRWDEFYNDVERDLRPGGTLEHITDWGSKLPGAVARIAGLLHMASHGREGIDRPISVDIVTGSCVLGGYFKEHALAAFRQMKEDAGIAAARKILSYLLRSKPERFKGRDVLLHAYFANRTMGEVMPGLKILLERGFIREVKGEYSGKGRPEAVMYEVNPKIFEI